MRALVALAALLSLGAVVPAVASLHDPKDSDPRVDERLEADAYHRTIFFAVLEGLYEDGISNRVVDGILIGERDLKQPSLFVPGCPLCIPARDAFRVYRERTVFTGFKSPTGTFGGSDSDAIEAKLANPDLLARHAALQERIQVWVKRRLDLMRLTPEEQTDWSYALAERRKKGMTLLPAALQAGQYIGAKTCAICDGSAGACPLK